MSFIKFVCKNVGHSFNYGNNEKTWLEVKKLQIFIFSPTVSKVLSWNKKFRTEIVYMIPSSNKAHKTGGKCEIL